MDGPSSDRQPYTGRSCRGLSVGLVRDTWGGREGRKRDTQHTPVCHTVCLKHPSCQCHLMQHAHVSTAC